MALCRVVVVFRMTLTVASLLAHGPCSATMVASGSPTGPDATKRSPKPQRATKSGRPPGISPGSVVNQRYTDGRFMKIPIF